MVRKHPNNYIERVRSLEVTSPVTSYHTSQAQYAQDSQNRSWVLKGVTCNELLAECIGYLMCRELGLPVPDAAYYQRNDKDEPAWLSKQLAPVLHWSRDHAQRVKNPEEVGGILALDAVIGNCDRNSGNLLLVPNAGGDAATVYAIDFADSWVGTPYDLVNNQGTPRITSLAPGLPLDMLSEGAHAYASEMEKINYLEIWDLVSAGCSITNEPEVEKLADALSDRCKEASRLAEAHLTSIGKR